MSPLAPEPDFSQLPKLDTRVPHTARIWNALLGGKDNFAVDRAVAEQLLISQPELAENARRGRAFLKRAVTYLAGEAGMRQFLDIGTGFPTADNTHEVAQTVASDCKIVYVDNDPLVLAHARALLTSTPDGVTDYVDVDLHHTDELIAQAARTLDFTRPVAVLFMGVLGHVEEDADAHRIVETVMAAVPPGSHLSVCDGTDTSEAVVEAARVWNLAAVPKYHLRSPARLDQFFDGLEYVEPGLVSVTRWRPEGAETPTIDMYGAVGRKP